jgi:predicted MFS family arabinose efflux permease
VLDIAVLRFTVGLGMAFVFAPGIALTARYFRKGSEGLAIGIYNSTFSLGSVVGLSGWAVLAQLVGWRAALLAGGLLGVATGLMLVIFVPADEESRDFRIKVQDLLHILLDRRLLLVGAGLLGINMALNLVNNFVVYYLEVNLSVPPVYAASVASLTWISGLFVSLVAGRLYDKIKSIRGLFFAAGIFSTAGMVVISYPLAYASVLGAVLVGSAVGIASTAGFSIAREAGREHPRYESLSISWVNSINYFGSFWSTLVFSYLALVLGYSLAWLVMGIAIFPSVLPFMLFRLNKETSRAPVSTASV